MKIEIRKEVFKKFHPKFNTGFILVEKADDKTKLKESRVLLKRMAKMVQLLFQKETAKNHHLISSWESVRQEFGKKAKHYQTSLEKLLKKVTKKRKVETRSVLVNLINYISLKHLVPMTVDDFDKIEKGLVFRIGKKKGKVLKKNMLYYSDGKGVLGTKLDFWKASRVKPGRKTTRFLIHMEALPPINNKKLREIIKETEELVKIFCGGKARAAVLSKKRNSWKV